MFIWTPMRRKEEEDENKETFVTFSPINAGVSTGVLLPLLCVSPDVRLFLMFGLPSILGPLLTLVVTTFSNQEVGSLGYLVTNLVTNFVTNLVMELCTI